jgi:hypothetical protein
VILGRRTPNQIRAARAGWTIAHAVYLSEADTEFRVAAIALVTPSGFLIAEAGDNLERLAELWAVAASLCLRAGQRFALAGSLRLFARSLRLFVRSFRSFASSLRSFIGSLRLLPGNLSKVVVTLCLVDRTFR